MDSVISSTQGEGVSKTFQPYTPRQAYLLPPSPSEWLARGDELLADEGAGTGAGAAGHRAPGEVLAMRVDPYIATGRTKHGAALPAKRRALQSAMPVKDWMRARLESEDGAAIYRRRKAIVEPVFGQIKHARGFRAFGLRGLRKVRGEFSLVATAHNLCKLYRRRSAPLTPS